MVRGILNLSIKEAEGKGGVWGCHEDRDEKLNKKKEEKDGGKEGRLEWMSLVRDVGFMLVD